MVLLFYILMDYSMLKYFTFLILSFHATTIAEINIKYINKSMQDLELIRNNFAESNLFNSEDDELEINKEFFDNGIFPVAKIFMTSKYKTFEDLNLSLGCKAQYKNFQNNFKKALKYSGKINGSALKFWSLKSKKNFIQYL